MSVVELKAVGPIESILFDLPEGQGGVKVFRGTSGVGKTTALRALGGLIGDKDSLGDLAPHDGTDRGEVTGLGRSLKISQRVSAAGASSVPHLGGKLDISTLVDPRLIDPCARTKARVRCLVSLGGQKLSPEQLLGSDYEDFSKKIDIDALRDADDPVAMADKIKRALERYALEVERESDRSAGMATAKRQEAGDIESLHSGVEYKQAITLHRQAMLAVGDAKRRREQFRQASAQNAGLREQIDKLEQQDVDSQTIEADMLAQARIVDGLKERLHAAQIALTQKQSRLEESKRHIATLDQLRSNLSDPGQDISEEHLSSLELTEQKALETLNQASLLATRKAALEQSIDFQHKSADLAEEAAEVRAVALAVQAEVQKALPAGPIQVQDGKLVVDYQKRGRVIPFEELSTGQKWKVAMEYAVAAVGEGGVIPLSQEAWQALGPELKDSIAQQCRDAKVWLVTGEVAEGELRVEDYIADVVNVAI